MRISRLAAGAIALLVALTVTATASASYGSAKLSVSYGPGTTRIVASSDAADDATARAAIVVSRNSTLDTSAAPGTKVGAVKAQVSALALGGALLPLAGDIIVAAPGMVPAASQTGCIGATAPIATYLLVLQAAGQTINLPAYILPTSGPAAALGTTQLVFCLAPPDVPVDKGGATFGAKFLSADMTFTGVFSPLSSALWVGLWTPWTPLVGVVNQAATVASPSIFSTTKILLTGKRVKGKPTLAGRITADDEGLDLQVRIWGAVGKKPLKPLKSVLSKENGTFAVSFPKTAKQTRFQARFGATAASVTGDDAKQFCTELFSSLPLPCSSATVAIAGSQSKIVTVR